MRWYKFGTDYFVCDCEKRKMYWVYIQFFCKKQAGKDVPKMCRRINQRFLNHIGRRTVSTCFQLLLFLHKKLLRFSRRYAILPTVGTSRP